MILATQQQNTGLDPRRQHSPQKLNAPGPPISFHYPQDSHRTPRMQTAITGSIRLLPRHPQPPQQSPLHGKMYNTDVRHERRARRLRCQLDAQVCCGVVFKVGGLQVQAQGLRAPMPRKFGRPTTPLTHRAVRPTIPQIQKSTTHATPTTPVRPTTPVVQLDEDTIRNAGFELDDDPFARM